MKRTVEKALCLLFLLGMALSCSASAEAAAGPAPRKIKAVVLPYISYAPFFIAQDEGFFREEGLEVEFVRLVQPMAGVAEVARGNIDMTQVGTRVGIFNAMARGANVRIVADKGGFSGEKAVTGGFVALKSFLDAKGKPDWDRLKGQRVSVDPTGFWAYIFEGYLNKNGVKLSDFVLEDLPVTSMPEAFRQGTVAITHLTEPWLSKILQEGNVELIVPDVNLAPTAHFSGLCFGPSLLEQDPDTGMRFMVAYLKGIRQYNKGKTDRNVEIIAKNTGLDATSVRNSGWPSIRSDGKMNVAGFVEFQRWAKKKGYLDSVVPAKKLWDPRFVNEANRRLALEKP